MNVPNVLSHSRIVLTIVGFFLLFYSPNLLFACLVLIGLTDCLDGFLARALKQQTDYGAKLDSIADLFFSISAILWFYWVFTSFVHLQGYKILIIILLGVLLQLFHFIRHKTMGSLHLWSGKLSMFVFFFFLLHTFWFMNVSLFFFNVVFLVYVLHTVEEFVVLLIKKNPPLNSKTVFHIWQ